VSILARDRNGPAIAKQILVMPMLDDRTVTPDPQLAPFVLWSWDDNCTGWHALLGDAAGGPDTPVSAAPARVADPAGLPPAYIEVGQLDIFRDEDLTYALRLGQAGSRSSSTSTPASRTSSTSLPSTPPPPGASWPTASAPSPPCDHAANGTSSLPRPRRHPRCLRRSSCTSSRWPPAKPPRPTTLFAGSRTGSTPTGTPQHARRRNPMNQIELSVGTIDYHDTGQGPTSVLLPGC
jgi:alpha/beta hydrolase fold